MIVYRFLLHYGIKPVNIENLDLYYKYTVNLNFIFKLKFSKIT